MNHLASSGTTAGFERLLALTSPITPGHAHSREWYAPHWHLNSVLLTHQGGKHPTQLVVVVGLGEKLSPTSQEDWWRKFAIVVPIITAIIAASATYAGKPSCDLSALTKVVADIKAATNDVSAFTAYSTSNICSGGGSGISPLNPAALVQRGSAIQAKLNGIATDLSNLQKK